MDVENDFSNSSQELEHCYKHYKNTENFKILSHIDFFSFLENISNIAFLNDCDLFIFHYIGHSTGSRDGYPLLFDFSFAKFVEMIQSMKNNVVAFIDCCNKFYSRTETMEEYSPQSFTYLDEIKGKHIVLTSKHNNSSYFNINTKKSLFTVSYTSNLLCGNFIEILERIEITMQTNYKAKEINFEYNVLTYFKDSFKIPLN